MQRVIAMHRDADSIVFLGDGIADARACERIFDRPIWQVAGNCDTVTALFSGIPTEQSILFGEKRILLTHGHRFGVKAGQENLAAFAAQNNYDIVLFGHTHERVEQYRSDLGRPLYLFNPGSIGSPRHGEPSFGLLQIQAGQVLLSHGEVPYI